MEDSVKTNIFHNLVFAFGEGFIGPAGPLSDEVKSYVEKNREYLKMLLSRRLLWHGTGRFHYKGDGVEDVLREIVKDEGIIPLIVDPWFKGCGKGVKTISLSKIRVYSSIYAEIHRDENAPETFRFGSRFKWAWLIGFSNFFAHPFDVLLNAIKFSFDRKSVGELIKLEGKFRKASGIKRFWAFIPQLINMPRMTSDIKGNYPILFAVKPDNYEIVSTGSGFDFYEARVSSKIKLGDISHVEVPIQNVEETRRILQSRVPVIPLEAVEYFLSENYSVGDLLASV